MEEVHILRTLSKNMRFVLTEQMEEQSTSIESKIVAVSDKKDKVDKTVESVDLKIKEIRSDQNRNVNVSYW